MAILKCKICGGDIDVSPDKTLGTCQYCGTTMTIPKIDSDKKARLYNRAIQYLNNCEFDRSYSAYESITTEDGQEAEAYWGMLLSEYGIEYVEDPKEKKRVPTCHRTKNISPKKMVNYDLAIKYASEEQKELYIKEADEIERLQNHIRSISSKEKPYDVFICYKYSDESGNPTEDSAIAHELFDSLEQMGLRVFFSKITLEDKLGTEYEPYIYAALKSARILLLVTTKKEYAESVWVKNEWSRFLSFMQDDKEKSIIPVYKEISPSDLPADLQKFQGIDISKLGAFQDLKHIVKKQVEWARQNKKGIRLSSSNNGSTSRLKWIAIAIGGVILALLVVVAALAIKSGMQRKQYADAEQTVAAVEESEPEPAPVEDIVVDTPEPEEPETPQPVSHKQELLDYAKKQVYVNGLTGEFSQYVSNGYKNLNNVPIGNIDCFVDDFDGDGEEELLIPSIEQGQWIYFTMYEYKDGVGQADQYEYRVRTLDGDGGNTIAFTYDVDGKKTIGVFSVQFYDISADGIALNFAGIAYDGQEFVIKGNAEMMGSDLEEDRNFMKTLRSCGIVASWDDLIGVNESRALASSVGGNRLFEINVTLDLRNPHYMYNDEVELYGLVEYTGYSQNSFTFQSANAGNNTYGMESTQVSEYIIPDSSDRYLTDADVMGLSSEELRIARNEIFARHGRRFKDAELQAYFDSKSWYRGIYDPDEFSLVVRLSDIEQKNMALIKRYE
ncbi:MAG: YARHG domain-containing protein [Lachnospiraceae bacterium]|nr:YARHG domain-containing protein [Lachnospiraceae bacterium]